MVEMAEAGITEREQHSFEVIDVAEVKLGEARRAVFEAMHY